MRQGCVVFALAAAMSGSARADFEWLVPVVQPVDSEGGLVPCVTTYSAYFAVEEEARALMALTVSPNSVMMNLVLPRTATRLCTRTSTSSPISAPTRCLFVSTLPCQSPNKVSCERDVLKQWQ